MSVLCILIPNAPHFELIFVLVLRLVLWSVIVVIPLVPTKKKKKSIQKKRGLRIENVILKRFFKEKGESFLYKLRWPSLRMQASARHDLWLMGFRLNCSASSKKKIARNMNRSGQKRWAHSLSSRWNPLWGDWKFSCSFFHRVLFPPVRTTVERPLTGCTQLRWILKQWVSSSG